MLIHFGKPLPNLELDLPRPRPLFPISFVAAFQILMTYKIAHKKIKTLTEVTSSGSNLLKQTGSCDSGETISAITLIVGRTDDVLRKEINCSLVKRITASTNVISLKF